MNPPDTLTLRPVNADDHAFLYRVYASTRVDELAPLGWSQAQFDAFVTQQFAAQSAHYWEHYNTGRFCVIENAGEPVGRLYVDRWADQIRIVDIALLPEYRNRGWGTALLAKVLAEGERDGLPVTIHVESFNPAQRLYQRLGFRRISGDDVYWLLERAPVGSLQHAC
ncbi:MAG: GNAT family N-acetyltransferase [Anaerolineales bacterium]|nr:GNAT family N-acetyltransferase [Anaerolineales bacterium]